MARTKQTARKAVGHPNARRVIRKTCACQTARRDQPVVIQIDQPIKQEFPSAQQAGSSVPQAAPLTKQSAPRVQQAVTSVHRAAPHAQPANPPTQQLSAPIPNQINPQGQVDEGYLAGKARIRVMDLLEAKKRKEKWVMLTSYDTISARIFDQAKIPCVLVGDSAAQMVYGYKSTLPVTMDELIPLARAVSSSCTRALVVADLPFGSYQESPEAALRAASRFMKESLAHAIKLEGGKEYESHVRLLVQSGIPVMGHIGFTPQSEHALSGFKIQGRDEGRARMLIEDALALERAGAFACVLELMPSDVGRSITRSLQIPTVGIGAGPDCDAQVLVWHDMAGFSASNASYLQSAGGSSTETTVSKQVIFKPSRAPKFVKQFANMGEILFNAARSYANEVRLGRYPSTEHSYDT